MVATFAVMYLFNYSLDNLSLMALTLSVGFVVDNTIVMLENIVRHMEMGKTPMRAAFEGSKEVAFTIVAMTVVARGDLHPGPLHGRPGRTAAGTSSPSRSASRSSCRGSSRSASRRCCAAGS